jgi:hypothetical protein
MKISKIPGLGRFGVFIDDLDFATITDEEWMEIGKLHMESLVTIIRNVKIDLKEYNRRIAQWGSPRSLAVIDVCKKYGITTLSQLQRLLVAKKINGIDVENVDREWFKEVMNITALEEMGEITPILRVSGKKDDKGNRLGMFAEGELLWHSNESGQILFSPGVSLLGSHGMVGSSTGFVTTPDWYQDQSESFRSELDEMVLLHKFTAGKISPGVPKEQDELVYRNMCPIDNTEIPLVIQSPIGIKGLHYSVNTIDSIKGMSKKDSDKVFERINKGLFTEKYIYDHWYKQDNDLLLFDNSITLHRRLGGITNRMAYRIQYDYRHISLPNWQPYFSEPYQSQYNQDYKEGLELLTQLGIGVY